MVAELAALSGRGGLAELDVFAIKLIAKCVLYKNWRSLFCCLWNKTARSAALPMRCIDKNSSHVKVKKNDAII